MFRKRNLFSSCIPPLILVLLFFMNFLSSAVLLTVNAANYTATESSKTYLEGLMDFSGVTFDYYLITKDIELADANISVLHYSSSGSWVTRDVNDSVFTYNTDGTDAPSISVRPSEGKTDGNKKVFSKDKLILKYPDIMIDSSGTKHTLTILVHDITFQNTDVDMNDMTHIFDTRGSGLWLACDNFGTGVSMDIDISIDNATSSQNLYMMFKDIDVTYEGYEETVKILSGIRDNTIIRIPKNPLIIVESGSQIKFRPDSAHNNGNTENDDMYRAGFSYVAKAQGTSFRWTGKGCATQLGIKDVERPGFAVQTQVHYETASSSFSGTKSWTDYTVADIKNYNSGDTANYSYTHTKSKLKSGSGTGDDYSWIFKTPHEKTASGTHTGPHTHYLEYERKRATYTFHKNPPSGVSSDKIGNMPTNQKVVCQNTSNGKAKKTSELKVPTLTDYEFLGWNTKSDGSGKSYDVYSNQYMKEDIDFYAQWKPKCYYVVYHSNNGKDETWTTGLQHKFGVTYKYKGQTTPWIPIATEVQQNGKFYKKGYHLWRWKFSNGSRTEYYYVDPEHPVGTDNIKNSFKDLTDVSESTVHIYAEWKPNPYILRIHENFAGQMYGAIKDYDVTYDKQFQLPKPQPWQHDALVYGYDLKPEPKVSATYRLGQYVKNLTELKGYKDGKLVLLSENPGVKDVVDDRNKPIIDLYVIWDLPPTITLSTPEIHLNSLKVASRSLEINNGTISRSELEAELMTYATVYDYEWQCRYPGTIPPGEHNGYTFKIASFEPAKVKDNASNNDADTYYVTFQVTDDANQSATAVLTLYVGNNAVDILVR